MYDGPAMRILDANANRAREALRVLEDYARFAINHDELSERLKQVRHEMATVLRDHLADAILHRDTPGDVGTDNKTGSEGTREDLAAVVTAAGKRLGEALRVIEEVLKTCDAGHAAAVEALRYRFYDLEQMVARTLRPRSRFRDVRLYVLITEALCRRNWLETAEEAILGGADCVQLREKEMESGELLRRATALVALCRKHGVLCIINDRPDVALLSGADGVHVGQTDLPAAMVRKVVGRQMIVGVSTHCIEQARQAVVDGADYVGVGPIFRSSTKTRDFVAGPQCARVVAQTIPIPAVAIAGITEENVDEVLSTGVRAIAVTAAVVCADDPRSAAGRLKHRISTAVQPVEQTFLSASVVGQTFLSARAPGEAELVKSRRRLPHWRLEGATYFITFRIARGELSEEERTTVLDHIRSGHGQFYSLLAAVVMPDHVHAILEPVGRHELSDIMKGSKGASARKINLMRATRGKVWQDESWDRIVRDQAELEEKHTYIMNNAVKRGLVDDPWEYRWWFVNEEPEVD